MITWLSYIDWNLLTGLGTLLAALAAAFALIQQSRLTRFSIGTQLLWTLEERFEDKEKMKLYREKCASALLKGEIVRELDMVIDYFEGVGAYLRAGMLDENLVWNMFCGRSFGYWFACQEYIIKTRAEDKSIWINFEYLIKVLIKIDSRAQRKSKKDIVMSPEKVRVFLMDEAHSSDPIQRLDQTRSSQIPVDLVEYSKNYPQSNRKTLRYRPKIKVLIGGCLAFLVGLIIGLVHHRGLRD